jgi:hypothetical protein
MSASLAGHAQTIPAGPIYFSGHIFQGTIFSYDDSSGTPTNTGIIAPITPDSLVTGFFSFSNVQETQIDSQRNDYQDDDFTEIAFQFSIQDALLGELDYSLPTFLRAMTLRTASTTDPLDNLDRVLVQLIGDFSPTSTSVTLDGAAHPGSLTSPSLAALNTFIVDHPETSNNLDVDGYVPADSEHLDFQGVLDCISTSAQGCADANGGSGGTGGTGGGSLVPEPSSLALFLPGLFAFGWFKRRGIQSA